MSKVFLSAIWVSPAVRLLKGLQAALNCALYTRSIQNALIPLLYQNGPALFGSKRKKRPKNRLLDPQTMK